MCKNLSAKTSKKIKKDYKKARERYEKEKK